MSITDKMRQLNPRVESKVAPIDKIQSILRELTVTPHYQQKGVHNPFYTLDIDVPKDKINDLLILISYVNQKNQDGFFIYDLEINKVKFHINIRYPVKLKNRIIENAIEDNLNLTNHLFHNFTLATHNLIYAEKKDQIHFELMFMEIVGYA